MRDSTIAVYNLIHKSDIPFIDASVSSKDVTVFREQESVCSIQTVCNVMSKKGYDLCFFHPSPSNLTYSDLSGCTSRIIVYSEDYVELDEWIVPDCVVKVPKPFVRQYWRAIIESLLHNPKDGLRSILRSVLGIEYEDSGHRIRNTYGPRSLLRMIENEQPVSQPCTKYIEDIIGLKEREGRSFDVRTVPFHPPDPAGVTGGGKQKVLLVDDDHRMGWSVLMSVMLDIPVKRLFELTPLIQGNHMEGFEVVPACSEDGLEPLRVGNAWDLREALSEGTGYVVALQQVGADPVTDSLQKPDISMFRQLLAERRTSSEFSISLIPFDLVLVDYRAANEKGSLDAELVSGYMIIHLLRKIDPSLPIIAFTASAQANTVINLLRNDILGYYQKPGRMLEASNIKDFERLRKMIEITSEYWWLRFFWGVAVWVENDRPDIRAEYQSTEFCAYLLRRVSRPAGSYHRDSSEEVSIQLRKLLVDRLKHLVRMFNVERMSQAGTIDATSLVNLKSESAVQLGLMSDYLFGRGGGETNPNQKMSKAIGEDNLLVCLCARISLFSRNVGAHGEADSFNAPDSICFLVQLITLTVAMFQDAIPDFCLDLVPSPLLRSDLSADSLKKNFRENSILHQWIREEDFVLALKSKTAYVLNGELERQLSNYLKSCGRVDELRNLADKMQKDLSGTDDNPSGVFREFVEKHADPGVYLVFFSFLRDQKLLKSDGLLLCANYLLLVTLIDLEKKRPDFLVLRTLLLRGSESILQDFAKL